MGDEMVKRLTAGLRSACADLSDDEKRIARAVWQGLADGDPVSEEDVADRSGVDAAVVKEALDRWPGVFRDDAARIVGFWGLAIPKMGHRFHAEGGKPIHAWCALDPFLIVPAIGRSARVESRDPVTGETVAMTVTPGGVRDLSHPDGVVSSPMPGKPFDHDVIQTFCHYVLNFASEENGKRWAARHEGTFLLPVADAFEAGRLAWSVLRDQE